MAGVVKAVDLPGVNEVAGAPGGARAWLDEREVRRRAGESLSAGLTRELWKYTPIKGFLESLADSTAGEAPALVNADQNGVRAVPLNALDAADEALVRRLAAERIDPERHPVADLALLRAANGWLIEVSGQISRPLEIHYPGSGVAPVFVLLAVNASLTLVEHLNGTGFLAQVTHVELAAGARLSHHRAALQKDVPHYSLHSIYLEQNAAYRLNQNCVGGKRRRSEVHVVLAGPGAEVDMAGAYLVEDGTHLDQQLVVEHRAGHTVSRQKFHGIGAGKGRSVFNGRIHIHRHAPQSDAVLSNKNLALHKDAEMNTKPELEIYTDDVRCAHGATVGQL